MGAATGMIRVFAALVLATLCVITTCTHHRDAHENVRPIVTVQAYPAPRFAPDSAVKGIELYRLSSPQRGFGGFSAMVWSGDGERLILFSDYGLALELPFLPRGNSVLAAPLRRLGPDTIRKEGRDIEAATSLHGTIWIALEHSNSIVRLNEDLARAATVFPAAMADWPANGGPEAMARLDDGRFLVLREGALGSANDEPIEGLLFAGDPTSGASARSVRVSGAQGYHPVDATATPDGRVLVLLRKVRLGLPIVFETRLALLDPTEFADGTARLDLLTQLAPPLPHDNYEGLALRENGARWDVWLVSDDNNSHFQSSWLARIAIDPAKLSPRSSNESSP